MPTASTPATGTARWSGPSGWGTCGSPSQLLIIAGALNGLILPISLGVMLVAGFRENIVGEKYRHPVWMVAAGIVVVCLSFVSGIKAVPGILQLF